MKYNVVIIGAGPGGLACAESLSKAGISTLVVEKNSRIGTKVCAGGITWNGLLRKAPGEIAERKFASQYIFTKYQKACITSDAPIIATVDRHRLGQSMQESAIAAGADVLLNSYVQKISDSSILVRNRSTDDITSVAFDYLVGADGSASTVRRYLQIPVSRSGIGINYQVPGNYPDMEWHLNSSLFRNGYAWIFPHKDTISVGAYVDKATLNGSTLKNNLIKWAEGTSINLKGFKPKAEIINYDYRGHRFGNIFLVGDAAGLASGLTGEGIFSAIVSGDSVAKQIEQGTTSTPDLNRLIKNHQRHSKIVAMTRKIRMAATLSTEAVTFGLRTGLLDFSAIEMAYAGSKRKWSQMQ